MSAGPRPDEWVDGSGRAYKSLSTTSSTGRQNLHGIEVARCRLAATVHKIFTAEEAAMGLRCLIDKTGTLIVEGSMGLKMVECGERLEVAAGTATGRSGRSRDRRSESAKSSAIDNAVLCAAQGTIGLKLRNKLDLLGNSSRRAWSCGGTDTRPPLYRSARQGRPPSGQRTGQRIFGRSLTRLMEHHAWRGAQLCGPWSRAWSRARLACADGLRIKTGSRPR